MAKWRWVIAAAVMVGLVVGGGIWLMQSRTAMGEQLYDQRSFLKLMRQAHIHVQRSGGSNTYAEFGLQPGASQVMWTDLGTMDVGFFPFSIEGKATVKEVGHYLWEVRGVAQAPQKIGSNWPMYFIVHRNLLISTHDQPLLDALQRALPTAALDMLRQANADLQERLTKAEADLTAAQEELRWPASI